MITDINSEDRLVQQTVADHLEQVLGWDSVYAFNTETFGPHGTLGRTSARETVLTRDLRAALARLNPELSETAREQALETMTRIDASRSLMQHNRTFHDHIRNGVPVTWRDADGQTKHDRARVIDFRAAANNRFLAVRELKIQGVRVPHYNRRADLVCFVNGLPLVFIELKAVYKNIRAGFDDNLTDYITQSIEHAFHHNVFLVVSNGDAARYGSITSTWEHFAAWKRNDEDDRPRLDTKVLLDGMLAKDRLLDLVENFILFDDSRAGGTRKVVARNHQVLGVNAAVAAVHHQEALKRQIPLAERLVQVQAKVHPRRAAEGPIAMPDDLSTSARQEGQAYRVIDEVTLSQRAHPDLGRLGVFWHTQGSGKSYSMAFFVEKVRRVVPGSFTFVVLTDREDLNDQIWRTFIGCGIIDDQTPRAASGKTLQTILTGNHRFVFTLVHKFNQLVSEPYSHRDDIIVLSDEAHRTQAGKFARNLRLALPNAAFIGFTGTPLFKHDELTKRIFGGYVSRYDFKRSEEDNSTVKLIYENRGEKLGIARLDLNDKIAEAVEQADLDDDQTAAIEKLLGKDYEVVTADDRLDKLADDFVEHVSTRWQTGKSMLVCIDKITCARMLQRIEPRWQAKLAELRQRIADQTTLLGTTTDVDDCARLARNIDALTQRVDWMASTIIEVIISEAQNEVKAFAKWGFDIIPHRVVMKNGFETTDGKRVPVEDAFKDPDHPFRIAIVCAMWLTGFDVECLATLYIDKPMRAHTLMQAIARANRVYPGKDCGVIVDYNGMLKSLREALAKYAVGDDGTANPGDVAAPIEELVAALVEAIETTEAHLLRLGFDPSRLQGAKGFQRIEAMKDATDALCTSDEDKRRFEIMARLVFSRFKALLAEPTALLHAERHDNIEAISRKLGENRDMADVTDVLKSLHRIVNEAIRAAGVGADHAEGLTVDLSQIDFERLRREFASKVNRPHAVLDDIRAIIDRKLAAMLQRNPLRMDFYRRYQEIIADYNREKDRTTVEATFAQLVALASGLDTEERRAAVEGLTDTELALFDLLGKDPLAKTEREKLKQASRSLLASLRRVLTGMDRWTENTSTQAEVKMAITDSLYLSLPRPPFSDSEADALAQQVYDYVWQQSRSGHGLDAA